MRSSRFLLKTAILKSSTLLDVLNKSSPSDVILARESRDGYLFFAWPGTPLGEVAEGLLLLPDAMRTLHTVFSRPRAIIDPVFDIDLPVPHGEDPREAHRRALQKVLEGIDRELGECGEAVERRAVLHSPSDTKSSFHVHLQLRGGCAVTPDALAMLCRRMRTAAVDLHIYRPMGMLRIYKSAKVDLSRPLTLYDEEFQMGLEGAKDSAERERCITAMSLCIRGTPVSRLLNVQPIDDNGQTSKADLPLTVDDTFASIQEALAKAPIEVAEGYHSWIRVAYLLKRISAGMADSPLTSYDGSIEDILESVFVQFSSRCPHKFNEAKCRKTFRNIRLGESGSSWIKAYRCVLQLTQEQCRSEAQKEL